MRVMVIVKATKSSEAGEMPSAEMLTAMGQYNEALVKAGIMLSGDGLRPSSQGVRVRFSGTERSVINGPFAETNELVAGYWIWQVKSMEEAIAWVKRCPNPMPEESEIEIRPFYETEDFAEADPTGEIRAAEHRLRDQLEAQQLEPTRLENGRAMLIAGINETYTFESRVNIPNQWRRFVTHLGNIPGQVGTDSFGVCWNFKEGCGFDYLTGIEVSQTDQLPEGFSQVNLPAQRYAVFAHSGHVSTIDNTIEAIWSRWLPSSGYALAAAPSFERYTKDFNPQTGQGGIEIWLPLKS